MLAPGEIKFLPVDLHRWDCGPGGEILVVPLWSDVRPLRGATGLLDWRLNGRLSAWLRCGRLEGTAGEKLLFPTERVPWRCVLAVGLGDTAAFSEDAFRASIASALEAMRGLGAHALAIAPPGRDLDRITPERALRVLLSTAERHQEDHPAHALRGLTVIDAPQAIKAMAETARDIQRSLDR